MKLMLEFRYQCEVEFKKRELNRVKEDLKKDKFTPALTKNINRLLLAEDGRNEWGEVVDYDYEIEEE